MLADYGRLRSGTILFESWMLSLGLLLALLFWLVCCSTGVTLDAISEEQLQVHVNELVGLPTVVICSTSIPCVSNSSCLTVIVWTKGMQGGLQEHDLDYYSCLPLERYSHRQLFPDQSRVQSRMSSSISKQAARQDVDCPCS
jgi:hypothetical protein